MDMDASDFGLGAVLSQEQNGQEKVICYFSRTLSRAERNYCVTRKELLALVKAIKHFHYYLYGQDFLVRMDHACLRWLLNFRLPEGQIARWIEKLQQYNFSIEHRPGQLHGNADILSRRPCSEVGCTYCSRLEEKEQLHLQTRVVTRENFSQEEDPEVVPGVEQTTFHVWNAKELMEKQAEDPDIAPLVEWKTCMEAKPSWDQVSSTSRATKAYWTQWESLKLIGGLLYRCWESDDGRNTTHLLVAPKSIHNEILGQLHCSTTAGHFGVKKTAARVNQRFYWFKWRKFVEDWCRKCDDCASRKGEGNKHCAQLQLYNVGSPMERIAVDVLGPLPMTDSGNQYILLAQDYFTKWPEAYPLPDQQATTVANVLVNQFFSRFGVPMELHTDQGRNFESTVFQEVCALLDICKTRTTPYHPQSDGMVERLNRTIEIGLTMVVNDNQMNWDECLPLFLMAYRTAVHETTKVTPSQMMFGREIRLPIDLCRGVPEEETIPKSSTAYAHQLEETLDRVHVFARKNISESGSTMKQRYDSKVRPSRFDEGSGVWLHNPRKKKGRSLKLSRNWEGPYVVVKHLNDAIVRIQQSSRSKPKVVHMNRLKAYHGPQTFEWFKEKKQEVPPMECTVPAIRK